MSKDDVDFCLTTPTSSAMSTLNRFAALFSFSFSPMDLNERVNFNSTLGADRETRHARPDLTNDITTLMESLNENNVYRFQKGRVSGEDMGSAVKDVILVGTNQGTRHAPPDLTNNIATLVESLNENNIYRFQKGKVLGDDTGGVEDTTLLRLSEEDVALDMDEVVMEVEEQEEPSDDDEDSEESGGLAED